MGKEDGALLLDLKSRVLSGGLALTLRSVAGFAVAALGNIFLVRLLSLKDYGLFAIAAFCLSFLNNMLEAGVCTWIIKSDDAELTGERLAAAFTFLHLGYAVILPLFALILVPALSRWYGEAALLPALLLLIAVPLYLNIWARIPMALMERGLNYQKVGVIEWVSQCFYYGPALLAAWWGLGVFSLLVGEITKSLSQAAMSCAFHRVRVKLSRDWPAVWEIARFGFAFKGANLIWDLNGAAAPILVGRLVSLEALGIVRVAQGILNQLSFFQGILWRVSVPAFSRLQEDKARVTRAVIQGAYCQLLLVGFPVLLVASQGYWLIPWLYGGKWQAVPLAMLLASLYPVCHAVFFMQISPFFATGKAYPVMVFNLCFTATLWSSAYLLSVRFGYLGFCAAGYFLCLVHIVLYHYFKKYFAPYSFYSIFSVVIFIYLAAAVAFLIKYPPLSLLVMAAAMAAIIFGNRTVRSLLRDLPLGRQAAPAEEGEK
jgi:O-antigen/teichoic acid export membrane protein